MRLKYKILWIEDEKDWVESEVGFIESFLGGYGFSLEYTNHEKYSNEDFSVFDLIVVDYNLAEEETGIEVIKKIRSQELYTEILFYSSDGEDKLRSKLTDLDGIYCASKTTCREKMKGIIYTTIRKTQDLNNLRGLVMSETSEIDQLMKEILLLCKNNYNLITSHNTFCKNGGCGACTSCEKKTKVFKDSSTLAFELRKRKTVDTTITGAMSGALLDGVISFLDSGIHSTTISSIDIIDYKEDIKRNLLAHYVEHSYSEADDSYTIIDDDGTPHTFNEATFSDMRRGMSSYRSIFEDLKIELINITP